MSILYIKFKSLDWDKISEVIGSRKIKDQVPMRMLFSVEIDAEKEDEERVRFLSFDCVEKVFKSVPFDLHYHSRPATNDPHISLQHPLAQVKFLQAHAFQRGSFSTKIAVLDTGLYVNHEEFANRNEVTGVLNFAASGPNDWHGTAVASCITPANDNNKGLYAPATVSLVVCDLWQHGFESFYALANSGARAINCSFGAGSLPLDQPQSWGASTDYALEFNAVVEDIVENYGVMFVASAGNVNQPFDVVPDKRTRKSFGVMASRKNGELAFFSSRGIRNHITAPGEDVFMTYLAPDGYMINTPRSYTQGTSFSAPLVTAVCGLVFSENPQLNIEQVTSIIKSSAEGSLSLQPYIATCLDRMRYVLPSGVYEYTIHDEKYHDEIGMVNALKAVLLARSTRREYAHTIVPCINIASVCPDITVTGGEIKTSIPDEFFTETLAYGDNWDETGTLKLYHGGQLVYTGGVKEVNRKKVFFDGRSDFHELFKNASDIGNISGGELYYADKSIGDACIALRGQDMSQLPGDPWTTTASITFQANASLYNHALFRVHAQLIDLFEGLSMDLLTYVDGVLQTSRVYWNWSYQNFTAWQMMGVDLSGKTGTVTVKLEAFWWANDPDKADFYNMPFLFDDIILDNVPSRLDGRIDLATITDDLFLVAECNGIKSGYLLPFGGSPVLKCTSITQGPEQTTLAAWDGATTYYKWSGDAEYSPYSGPLTTQPDTLTFYSTDAAFSENPMAVAIQTDFDPPEVVTSVANGLITLYEPVPDPSQPVTIYYRWDLEAWQTYSTPLPIQSGALWWYAVDSVGNESAVSHELFSAITSKDLSGNSVTGKDLAGNTVTSRPLQ